MLVVNIQEAIIYCFTFSISIASLTGHRYKPNRRMTLINS